LMDGEEEWETMATANAEGAAPASEGSADYGSENVGDAVPALEAPEPSLEDLAGSAE
jgi:hypothetical protein